MRSAGVRRMSRNEKIPALLMSTSTAIPSRSVNACRLFGGSGPGQVDLRDADLGGGTDGGSDLPPDGLQRFAAVARQHEVVARRRQPQGIAATDARSGARHEGPGAAGRDLSRAAGACRCVGRSWQAFEFFDDLPRQVGAVLAALHVHGIHAGNAVVAVVAGAARRGVARAGAFSTKAGSFTSARAICTSSNPASSARSIPSRLTSPPT